jgi:hypothetical protein
MKDLSATFEELMATMNKAEQDRLWDHFVKTGQVLPTIDETQKRIALLKQQINEIEKLLWVNPFKD